MCDRLYCDDKDWPRCVTTYTGAADGTPCGDQKVQYNYTSILFLLSYQSVFIVKQVCYNRRCVNKNRASVPQLPEPSMFNPRLRYNDPDGDGVTLTDPVDTVDPDEPTADPPTPECISDPSRATVHGQWGAWSAPSVCTRSCGGGFQRQNRSCDRPE